MGNAAQRQHSPFDVSKIGIIFQFCNIGSEMAEIGSCFLYVIGGVRGDVMNVFYPLEMGWRVRNISKNRSENFKILG